VNMTVRRCARCGREDLRERWSSIDAAAKAGALSAAWACPSCAWPEADLAEASSDAAPVSAVPHEAPPGREPERSTLADEAKRVLDSTYPSRRF
jgi:hypothetical protein